ncbi:MAG: hypothetical protein A3J40_09575 [Erythrobacter sp. RIFCSPHIGHO2_12_FULL_63_10]|nr:MAG: hypothetical protein A3J40_09575 [Erythrobacter sp. RIFCSPHIGHO2_12_FULL_63_10]
MIRKKIVCAIGFAMFALVRANVANAEAELGRFAEEIHVFAIEDEVRPAPPCATLFVGSSSIRFWFGIDQAFPGRRIVKRGFGGATIGDINRYFDSVVGHYRSRQIVFYAGENDLDLGMSAAEVEAEFGAFMQRKREVHGATPVFFVAAKPSPARWQQFAAQTEFNRRISAMADERDDLVFVDIATPMLEKGEPISDLFISDRLHMNAKGYALWQQHIGTALRNAKSSKSPYCR